MTSMKFSTNSGLAMLAFLRPPFFSDAASGLVLGKYGKIFSALTHGIRIASQDRAYIFQSSVTQLCRFHRRVSPPVLFGKRIIKSFHLIIYFWSVGYHVGTSRLERSLTTELSSK